MDRPFLVADGGSRSQCSRGPVSVARSLRPSIHGRVIQQMTIRDLSTAQDASIYLVILASKFDGDFSFCHALQRLHAWLY